MNRVIFDCERMKYEQSGIYNYCLNLGMHLQQRINPHSEQLSFYVPKNVRDVFKGHHIRAQHPLHKLCLPFTSGYDIWHSTFQHSDYLPSAHQRIKVILTVHDLNFMYDESIPDHKKEKYLNNLQKRVERADVIICISEYAKKDVSTFCMTHDKPLVVIHNGTNTLQEPLLGPASYKPKRPFLFSIGAIRRKKNFHVILPLLKYNANLDLVIAGKAEDKDYLNNLHALAREEGIQDRLHMLGQISEPEKSWYYHNCKAFLFPSIAEGFGLPLVEAMSIGKPVFLSNRTSLPEIGSTAAFYFNDFSTENMQESFIKGMNQYETQNMTDMIKKRAGHFSWEKAADNYINIYQSLYNQR